MVQESKQHALDRIRSPRVQITYDVEIGDAIEKKELPFVMGVMADFTGKPVEPLPKLKERKFVNIDRDNFNDVLAGAKPHLVYQVDNVLQNNDTQMAVELYFKSMADFEPAQVAKKIEPLNKLMEIRNKLSDLKNKMCSNERLSEVLQEIIDDADKLNALGKETGFSSEAKENPSE